MMTKHVDVFKKEPAQRTSHFRVAHKQLCAQQSTVKVAITAQEQVTLLSLKVANMAIRKHRPYTEGDFLADVFQETANTLYANSPVAQRLLTDVPLSANTFMRRVEALSGDLLQQAVDDIKKAECWAVGLDESCDVTDSSQLCVIGRYPAGRTIREEFLALLPLRTHSRGIDVYNAFIAFCDKMQLPITTLCHVATDGGPAMIGSESGFVNLLKRDRPNLTSVHCIVHREALAAQTIPEELNGTMNVAIDAVNFIKARALNRRLFRELCDEQGEDYRELVMHTAVRWLSKGNMLHRLFILRDSVLQFLEEQRSDLKEAFSDVLFLCKLGFLSDIFQQLNELNVKLQGKSKFIFEMLEHVHAFVESLALLREQLLANDLELFDCVKECRPALPDAEWNLLKPVFASYLDSLTREFHFRFPDMYSGGCPTVRFPFDSAPAAPAGRAALQLIDLRANADEKRRFDSCANLTDFWLNADKERYPDLRLLAVRTLTNFGSTYLCETCFSTMTAVKTKVRSSLTDEHLEQNLRVALSTYAPNYFKLVAAMQPQASH
jgi:zinc finger BED domain-containing protein 5/7/8/9